MRTKMARQHRDYNCDLCSSTSACVFVVQIRGMFMPLSNSQPSNVKPEFEALTLVLL